MISFTWWMKIDRDITRRDERTANNCWTSTQCCIWSTKGRLLLSLINSMRSLESRSRVVKRLWLIQFQPPEPRGPSWNGIGLFNLLEWNSRISRIYSHQRENASYTHCNKNARMVTYLLKNRPFWGVFKRPSSFQLCIPICWNGCSSCCALPMSAAQTLYTKQYPSSTLSIFTPSLVHPFLLLET